MWGFLVFFIKQESVAYVTAREEGSNEMLKSSKEVKLRTLCIMVN